MKNTAKNIVIRASMATLFIMAIFGVIPTIVEAYYDYNYDSYGSYYSNSLISNRYSYDARPTPVSYSVPVYYPVYTPVYTPIYPAIQATCYANASNVYNSYNNSNLSIRTNDAVIWYANVSGGTGSYSYSWSGSDSLYGYGSSIIKSYYSVGTKYATLSVTSGNQTISISCNNTVNVYQPVIYYPQPYAVPIAVPVQYSIPVSQYQMNPNNSLDIGCFVDPTNASINQPVNWSAEVTGGRAPYIYSWTGSDGLTGNQSSIIKYYATSGEKSAIVSVTSADGRTGTRACSNVITVRKAYVAPKQQPAQQVSVTKTQTQSTEVQNQNQTANVPLGAVSAFSLSYVPWGWVALLIIFVLFATVMYLLFNRPKI
ncbi:MAG: hypothetical protein AAB777_03005 [Patescibacteria group bacterium]